MSNEKLTRICQQVAKQMASYEVISDLYSGIEDKACAKIDTALTKLISEGHCSNYLDPATGTIRDSYTEEEVVECLTNREVDRVAALLTAPRASSFFEKLKSVRDTETTSDGNLLLRPLYFKVLRGDTSAKARLINYVNGPVDNYLTRQALMFTADAARELTPAVAVKTLIHAPLFRVPHEWMLRELDLAHLFHEPGCGEALAKELPKLDPAHRLQITQALEGIAKDQSEAPDIRVQAKTILGNYSRN